MHRAVESTAIIQRKLSQFRRALFEKVSRQVTLDLLERNELPSGDFRPAPLDGCHLLQGRFVPGNVRNTQIPAQRVIDEP